MTQFDKTYVLLSPKEFLHEKTGNRTGVFYFYKTINYFWEYNIIIVHCKQGKFHREDGPAYIFKSKSKYYEEDHEMWFIDDKIHRLDGFASSHGQFGWFYVNNRLISGEEDSVALGLLNDKDKLKSYLTLLSLKYA